MTIEKLRELGANVDEGLARCMNDEGFYLMLVPDALGRARYEDIDNRIRSNDLKGAFEAAHAMKGVLANLAITPLAEVVSELTELLRSGAEVDYTLLLDRMWEVYGRFEE
jgi:hypothetical protein